MINLSMNVKTYFYLLFLINLFILYNTVFAKGGRGHGYGFGVKGSKSNGAKGGGSISGCEKSNIPIGTVLVMEVLNFMIQHQLSI